jgi:histidyl-tRNA synthetase
VEELGGPSTPAVGFAIGVVPTLLAVEKTMTEEVRSKLTDFDAPVSVDVYVVAVDAKTRLYGFRLLENLRRAGIAADGDYEGRSLKAQMRSANRMKAKFVAVVGPEEQARNEVSLKRMSDGTTESVPFEETVARLGRD